MFMNKKFLFLLAAAAATASPGASVLDKGGVTFDFQKISAGLFKPAAAVSQAENLVTNADYSAKENPKDPLRWQPNYCYLHTNAIPGNDPRRNRARKVVKWSVKDGVFTVTKPEELKSFLSLKVIQSTSGGWRKTVNLPDDQGGLYNITFQYRGKINGPGGAYLLLSGNSSVAGSWWKGKNTFFKVYRITLSDEYQNYKNAVLLPPGTRSIELVPRIDGTGFLSFRNMAVTVGKAAQNNEKITLQLAAMGRLDHTFALAQDLPGTIAYVWKRNGSPANAKLTAPRLVVTMPKEVAFHEAALLKLVSKKATQTGFEYKIDLTPWRNRPAQMSSFDGYLRLAMLISTKAAPGSKLAKGQAWVEDKGVRVSNIVDVNYTVIPKFKAQKPLFFKPGIYVGGIYMDYKIPENIVRNAKMFDASGLRWLISGDKKAYPVWRKIGITTITPELYFIANGFRVGPPEGRPENDKYRYIGDIYKSEMERSTCPAAVYEKRPFFMNKTVPYIKRELTGADGLWANWEPYYYAGRGCFCDTCCKNFAKFVNVPLAQMKKEWPQELAMGRKYYKQAVRFRSLEHAKLMNTLNEVITVATGGKGKSLGFIPGVQVDNMSSTWRQNGFDRETHPSDYAGNFDWIDPWGPYAFWYAHTPFVYNKTYNLRTFLKAKDVRAAVNKDYKKHIKLLAFPHGLQGNDWVTQPESLTIEILSFLFNGWEGATVYSYPKGYDARYWKALATASDVAARYDKYVFKGKRVDEKVILTPLPPYAADTAIIERMLGTHTYSSLLQHTSYELNGTLIVAAFNFWRDGEVFFTLKVKGLSPKVRYTVRNADTRFTGKGGKSFTGKELADGITLHAGAVRCAVYEIAPEKAADKKLALFTCEQMSKAQNKARPALLKAKVLDDKYEKTYGIKESRLTDMANGGIICKADNVKKTLSFTSGRNTALLETSASCLSQWNVDGQAVIHGFKASGAGAVAFWYPSVQLARDFVVTEQKKVPGGLAVTMERRLLDRDNPAVGGLVVRETITLTDKLRKTAVNTTIINESDRSITFGPRYNFMPTFPAMDGGVTRVFFKGKACDFKRDMNRSLYSTGLDKLFEKESRKIFEVTSPSRPMDSNTVWFIQGNNKVKLVIEPKSALAGAAVWDGGNQRAATFEPSFKHITLAPGGAAFTFSSVLTLEK